MENKKNKYGSFIGLVIALLIGFVLYFITSSIQGSSVIPSYMEIVEGVNSSLKYKLLWFFSDFTEPVFFASFMASIMLVFGGFVAYILDIKGSKYRGFDVSYGSGLWPWVLASQILSLSITIFAYNFTRYLSVDNSWVPTFITVVGIAPALMLLYGPGLKKLLTVSVLASTLSFPIATWISTIIVPLLEIPGVVANVFTMAITGILITAICKVLPWMEKTEFTQNVQKVTVNNDINSPTWFVRRVFADFSEAQFYGNEIAGAFLIIGVLLDLFLSQDQAVYGSHKLVGAVLLSQFVGSSTGVFLYADKFKNCGWYPTFVPVVSVGPACVLIYGASIPVAMLAGLVGGIIGAPLAEFINGQLPEGYHGTIGNVASMGITTIVVSYILKALLG